MKPRYYTLADFTRSMNLYPKGSYTKTDRVNKSISNESIHHEKSLIDRIFLMGDFSDDYKREVLAIYEKTCHRAGVHTWKKSGKRIAFIICIFFTVSGMQNTIFPSSILKILKVKLRDVMLFKNIIKTIIS